MPHLPPHRSLPLPSLLPGVYAVQAGVSSLPAPLTTATPSFTVTNDGYVSSSSSLTLVLAAQDGVMTSSNASTALAVSFFNSSNAQFISTSASLYGVTVTNLPALCAVSAALMLQCNQSSSVAANVTLLASSSLHTPLSLTLPLRPSALASITATASATTITAGVPMWLSLVGRDSLGWQLAPAAMPLLLRAVNVTVAGLTAGACFQYDASTCAGAPSACYQCVLTRAVTVTLAPVLLLSSAASGVVLSNASVTVTAAAAFFNASTLTWPPAMAAGARVFRCALCGVCV